MDKNFTLRNNKISWQKWILATILFFGIFLRVYHIQGLLVFASDQLRDLNMVRSVVNGNAPLPLL